MTEMEADSATVQPPKRHEIFAAIQDNDLEEVKALLARGVDPNEAMGGYTPLMTAAECGNVGAIGILLDNGAVIDAKNDHGKTALLAAVKQDRIGVVRLLIEKGAALDEVAGPNSLGALHIAAARGYVEIVRLLIDGLADINKQNWFGETALARAEYYAGQENENHDKYEEIIQLLKDAPVRQEEIRSPIRDREMHDRIAIKQQRFKTRAASRKVTPGGLQ